MYEKCAKSLACHAATVFRTMTGHEPSNVVILDDCETVKHNFTLGARVNFKEEEADGPEVKGFFICAFETKKHASDFALDISRYLGLNPSDTANEIDNYVGEFLNVVIGLTCSSWADHGLRMEFDPPERLQEHSIDKSPSSGYFFEVGILAENFYKTILFVHFLPLSI
jgi:hypothetical protein